MIAVAAIPQFSTDLQKGSEMLNLFKHDHNENIYSVHVSSASNTKTPATANVKRSNSHDFWRQVSVKLPFQPTHLPGPSTIAINAVKDLMQDIENMWSGGTFHYALSRLLTIYFRCKLALERENRYKEYVTKKSAKWSQRKEMKLQNPSRCTQKQRIQRRKRT
jgi:hypothetical protein